MQKVLAKQKRKIFFVTTILLAQSILSVNIAKAQNLCEFFPCGDVNPDSTTTSGVNSRIEEIFRLTTSLIFVGLIALGIFIIIKAALKIIRSEGNAEELESGVGAIKSVFIGIGLIIGGLIGLVLIGGILGDGILNFDIPTPEGVTNLPI